MQSISKQISFHFSLQQRHTLTTKNNHFHFNLLDILGVHIFIFYQGIVKTTSAKGSENKLVNEKSKWSKMNAMRQKKKRSEKKIISKKVKK